MSSCSLNRRSSVVSSTDVERFLSIRTFENLAEYLGISPKELGFFAHSKKDFYSVWYIYKKNGTGRRKIASPCSKLKRIQRTLHDVLIQIYEPPDCVHGFLSERSIVTNACQHIGTPGIAKIDLKDFFPSITAGRIRGLFLSKPFCFPAKVANALTNLVCADGSLP